MIKANQKKDFIPDTILSLRVQEIWDQDISMISDDDDPTFEIYPIPLSLFPLVWIPGSNTTRLTTNCPPDSALALVIDSILIHKTTQLISLIKTLNIQICDIKCISFLSHGEPEIEEVFIKTLLESIPNVIHLCLHSKIYGNERMLLNMKQLIYLTLQFTNDKELEVISEIKQLKQLRVLHSSMTEKGFTLISKLTNLRMLEIFNPQIYSKNSTENPKGQESFSKMTQTLSTVTSFTFDMGRIQNFTKHLTSITGMSNLLHLQLLCVLKKTSILLIISRQLKQLQALKITSLRKGDFNVSETGLIKLLINSNLKQVDIRRVNVGWRRDYEEFMKRAKGLLGGRNRKITFKSYYQGVSLMLMIGERI